MRATANCTLIVVCVYFHQSDCQRLSHSPTFYNPNPLLLLTAQFKNISGFWLSGQIGTKWSILLPRCGAFTQQEGTSRSLRARLFLFIFDCVSHQDMHSFLLHFKILVCDKIHLLKEWSLFCICHTLKKYNFILFFCRMQMRCWYTR